MKKGGILVPIVNQPSDRKASELGVRGAFVFIEPNAYILEQLAELVEQGKLRPVIGAEFAFQDIEKAHALSESERTVGKIVCYVGASPNIE
jgi:NADPH:quinone reductase-like Zn-dependent oxidoreductase